MISKMPSIFTVSLKVFLSLSAVESITFVEQYARETAGSKKALEKIKDGAGASI